jgi:hypothetical protein
LYHSKKHSSVIQCQNALYLNGGSEPSRKRSDYVARLFMTSVMARFEKGKQNYEINHPPSNFNGFFKICNLLRRLFSVHRHIKMHRFFLDLQLSVFNEDPCPKNKMQCPWQTGCTAYTSQWSRKQRQVLFCYVTTCRQQQSVRPSIQVLNPNRSEITSLCYFLSCGV